jgi:hypothetical protein
MATLILAAAILLTSPAAADQGETLVARIFDTLDLPAEEIARLLRTAEDALAPGAVHIRWKPCFDNALSECHPAPGHDLIVRIVEGHGEDGRGSCGYAMVDGRRAFVSLSRSCAVGTLASLERKWELTTLQPLTIGEVLGYVLAHEIAHVLLPGVAHSARGLFKPRLHARDWRSVRQRGLAFTPDDIARLRTAAANLKADVYPPAIAGSRERRSHADAGTVGIAIDSSHRDLDPGASCVLQRKRPEHRPPDQIVEDAHPAETPWQRSGECR